MEIAVKTLFLGGKPTLINFRPTALDFFVPNLSFRTASCSLETRCRRAQAYWRRRRRRRRNRGFCPPVSAVLSGAEEIPVASSQLEEDSVITTGTKGARELKMSVKVSGARTRDIFDNVFDKMVAAAQPIPGFRRAKGGKTPDIPRDILLEVLGPSKVYKEVIKKVINSTVAKYVEKEGLKVSMDLRVEQSSEELEDAFEPGENFSFDAVLQLQETN